jgi:two-component system sensor kinase FixL
MEGQPLRRVTISSRRTADGTVEIGVADTGPGLSAEVQQELFSPFHSDKPGGMGIGLSISRTIVEAHGGKIWAENGDAGGAIFRFTLPMAEKPAKEREASPSTA